MLVVSFVAGLALLTLLFNGVLERQGNPNRSPVSGITDSGTREVILQQNRQGHYVTTGAINGIDVEFLLDTGATDVAIPGNVAENLGLQIGYTGQAFTANGPVTVYTTTLEELRLGNIVLQDIGASITPSMPGNTILLGMSALRQVEFSQQGNQLTLRHYPF